MKRTKKYAVLFLTIVLVGIVVLAGCQSSETPIVKEPVKEEAKELVIYSGRKEPLIIPIIEKFEAETGIKVILNSGGASELANVILEEKNNPKGDVFIANDAGTLEKLRIEDALETNQSSALAVVPDDVKAKDGSWVGVSGRAMVVMYNKDLVTEAELPTSVLELSDLKWRGQVAIVQSSNESFIGFVTALRNVMGDEAVEKFLNDLKNNDVSVLKGHTDIRKAVGTGEFKLGLVNHYYYHMQVAEGSPVGVAYLDQGDNQMGTMLNVSGVGIIKGAKNKDVAQKFVDFLLQPETQKAFAELNYEMPTVDGVPVKDAKALTQFRRMNVQLQTLGVELDNTMDLLEKVNLQQ